MLTLYARVCNKRYTLAVRQLVAGETTSDALAEFLALLNGLDLRVKAVYLDRGFYNSTCLELLYAHDYAYAMPIIKWGATIQDELNSGWSRVIEHDLAGKVTFPVFIDCVYHRGRYDEHGVARHGNAADAPFITTPRQARRHYSKRFGIEASYRLAKQSLALISSRDAGLRLLLFVVSLLLQNVWRYLHWMYVAAPPAGGAASGSGRSESSARCWFALLGQPSVSAGLSQQINHSTTGSSGSLPSSRATLVSGNAVASAAIHRRQRLPDAETHWYHLSESSPGTADADSAPTELDQEAVGVIDWVW